MTTIEKLFVQIFERKNWIIEQVKQQTDLYDQHLASKLLIDGITPPSWLWNPNFHSQSSDPKDLRKEELISKLLLPHPRPAVPYSGGLGSLRDESLVTIDNVVSSDRLFLGAHASNKHIDDEDVQTNVLDCHDINTECVLNCVPELDFNLTSPLEQRDAIVSNTCTAPDQSLARIQRSKSRQKALELRNSAKAVAKSRLSHENNNSASSSGFEKSRIASQQPEVDKFLELAKFSDISRDSCELREAKGDNQIKENNSNIYQGGITRSVSSYSGHMTSMAASQQPDYADEFLKLARHSNIGSDSCAVKRAKEDCIGIEEGTNSYCGRVTRSRSSCKQPSDLKESYKLDSTSDIVKEDSIRKTRSQTARSVEGTSEPVNSSIFNGERVTRSKSGASKKSPVSKSLNGYEGYDLQIVSGSQVNSQCPGKNDIANLEGRTEILDETEAVPNGLFEPRAVSSKKSPVLKSLNIYEGHDLQNLSVSQINSQSLEKNDIVNQEGHAEILDETEPVPNISVEPWECSSRSSSDVASLRVGLEALVSRPPPDCSMFLKPKQLDYDDAEECNLNEVLTPMMEKGVEESSETRCTSVELASLPHKVTSGHPDRNSFEKQLAEELVVSRETGGARRVFSEAYFQDRPQVESNVGANPILKSVESNSEAILQIYQSSSSHEPEVVASNVVIEADAEMHQKDNSPLADGFESSHEVRVEEGKLGPEGRDNSGSTPSLPSSSEQEAGDLKGTLFEDVEMADPTSIFLDLRNQSCVQENQNDMCLENKVDRGMSVDLDCTKRTPQERKSHLGEDRLFTHGSVRSPHSEEENGNCFKLSESEIAKKSLQQGRGLSTAFQNSWPQFKRRKIEVQQTNFCSASPSFRGQKPHNIEGSPTRRSVICVEDDSDTVPKCQDSPVFDQGLIQQSIGYKSPNVEMHQKGKCILMEEMDPSPILQPEEDEVESEVSNKSTHTPLASTSGQLEPFVVSSLTKMTVGDSEDFVVEGEGIADPASTVIGTRRHYDEQDYQDLLHYPNITNLGDGNDLTCTVLRERKSPMENHGMFSFCSVMSPHNKHMDLISDDQTRPVFEGFIINAQREIGQPQSHTERDKISLEILNLQNSSLERASILEQLCKSASMSTPLSQFSTAFNLHGTPDLYQSVPNGLLEHMNLNNLHSGDKQVRASYSSVNEVNHSFQVGPYSDSLPYSGSRFGWSSEKPYLSPVEKLWERRTSNSDSSGKQQSLNPELICFRIDEDPSISEENENTDEEADKTQEGIDSLAKTSVAKREPLAEITETELIPDRGSLESVNADIEFTGTRKKLENRYSNRRRCTNEAKENRTLSMAKHGSKKATESLHNRFSKPKLSDKTSLNKGGHSLAEREPKRNNIVSNITSFIPLIQQKQAAAVCTGKRDIKVKALEAAEAAKRLEEKRDNERKMKKEALKLKRARMEQENLRQVGVMKKKKEEEQKKKDADIAARKRVREEVERKEKERKRQRIEETRRQQREREEKNHAGKVEKEVVRGAIDGNVNRGNGNMTKNPESEMRTTGSSKSDVRQTGTVCGNHEALSGCDGTEKATTVLDTPENCNLVSKTSREKSYEISPYQCSDDEEEEEEDDVPTRKFVPSWASKSSVALVLSSQQEINPDEIFPPESFCRMDEVLVPRKLQLK